MQATKTIGLVAHDACKQDLVDWVTLHRDLLLTHHLVATGTTGSLIENATGLKVELLKSGPLGGDSQLGARIAEGKLDMLIFFTDPLSAMPHDVDVKALTRLATLYNVVMACNRMTADFIIESPLLNQPHTRPPLPEKRA
ncbi:MAG: methylglyoxal synthase [Alphaproteobacteria bacterium]|nr:methylglyoxal synthase [Alphaproteobacteria bacterium]